MYEFFVVKMEFKIKYKFSISEETTNATDTGNSLSRYEKI